MDTGSLFFRPSPSRLSFHHWGIKREHGPVRSPTCPYTMATTGEKRNSTPNKQKKKKTTETNKKETSVQWTNELQSNWSSLCADELNLAKSKHPEHHCKIAMKVQKQRTRPATRKPRISPARIPEIAPRSPQGMTGTFIHVSKDNAINWDANQQQAPAVVSDPNKKHGDR